MSAAFIDTNVLIRFLTGDDKQKQEAAAMLFRQVEEGALTIAAPDTVIADAVFVLSSKRLYHLDRAKVSALLTPLVKLPGFHVQNRLALLRALEVYAEKNLDFGDALIIGAMEKAGSDTLYSYDTDFDSFPGITRQEPRAA
ncbi:MAG TPA: PIN domain-containing protein [Ktedonobacterales bacterium]|nr:PIN domain-containing protein [Ktedonobacterales bacterium]